MDEVTISPEDSTLVLTGLLDQNPAAVYLATLRPTGRRGMLVELNRVAEIATNGKYTALTLPWHQLRYQHTAAIVSALLDRGYKPSTVNHTIAALRGVLYHAWKLGLIGTEDYMRARDIKAIKSSQLLSGRALERKEILQLMQVCKDDSTPTGIRDAAMIGVLYGTGIRRSELVKLNLKDYNRVTGALVIWSGKGGKDRLVYVMGGAATALGLWLAQRGDSDGPLFLPISKGKRQFNRRLTTQSVLWVLEQRANEAGLQHFSPHDMRRTYITDLLDAGIDIATVQKLAGHSNVATTARYDRRGEEAKIKATEVLNFTY